MQSRLQEVMGRYDFNGESLIVMQYKEWFDDLNKIVVDKPDFNENLDLWAVRQKNIKINSLHTKLLDILPR